jgi:hypothetical protein
VRPQNSNTGPGLRVSMLVLLLTVLVGRAAGQRARLLVVLEEVQMDLQQRWPICLPPY